MARKTFTTTIEETVQKDFKLACVQNDVKMNDVLETFMKSYIDGEFVLEMEPRLRRTNPKSK
ncbi:hypothetical protein [Niallia circulans]|uniref:Uncharacterized protein n=1 Tax=Niallia circulans TaxID=1397 RepID=A0A941GEZ6_NIACI|nr:hypothetical protein [Niallia circulans]MCB5238912.1 hypothetical protein [Niallia circulans]